MGAGGTCERIEDEILDVLGRGRVVDPAHSVERHPEHEERLRELFALEAFLRPALVVPPVQQGRVLAGEDRIVRDVTVLCDGLCNSDPYLLLGSLNGTAPGIPVDGVVLPLNFDLGYLAFTLANPNTAPLANSLGMLDATGQGSATFSLPPASDASLAGLALHHAYLVFDLAGAPSVAFASNAEPLTLAP